MEIRLFAEFPQVIGESLSLQVEQIGQVGGSVADLRDQVFDLPPTHQPCLNGALNRVANAAPEGLRESGRVYDVFGPPVGLSPFRLRISGTSSTDAT